MFFYVKIVFVLALFFSIVGCGGTSKSFDSNTSVYLNNELGNSEKNVTKYLNKLEEQLGGYNSYYVSKDKNNIFLTKGHIMNKYSFLDYDITGKTPVLRHVISTGWDESEVVKVIPLDKGKLLYHTCEQGSWNTVYVYDYMLKRDIRSYKISLIDELMNCTKKELLYISSDEKTFLFDDLRIDISDIYKDPLGRMIFRDDNNQVVVDYTNNLIWQDNESVINNTFTSSEAISVCNIDAKYNWRLPTPKDINYLHSVLENALNSSVFKNHNDDTTYWLTPINDSYDQLLWSYSTFNSQFYNLSGKPYFSLGDNYNSNKTKRYVRCVADRDTL